jgi:hypothetical protein
MNPNVAHLLLNAAHHLCVAIRMIAQSLFMKKKVNVVHHLLHAAHHLHLHAVITIIITIIIKFIQHQYMIVEVFLEALVALVIV